MTIIIAVSKRKEISIPVGLNGAIVVSRREGSFPGDAVRGEGVFQNSPGFFGFPAPKQVDGVFPIVQLTVANVRDRKFGTGLNREVDTGRGCQKKLA